MPNSRPLRKNHPLPACARGAECASRKKPPTLTGAVFVLAAQAVESPQEKSLAYGECTSWGIYVQFDPIGLAGGPNGYMYVGANPLSNIDPLGLWSVTFGAYLGAGGQVTFGSDNGNGFFTGRVGFGLGGGFSYNPNGGIPGPAPQDPSSGGVVLSCSAKGNFNAGPLSTSLEKGVARNYSNAESAVYGGASASARDRFSGLGASGSVGGQVTIYSGRR